MLLYQILTLIFSGVHILICSCIIQKNSLKNIHCDFWIFPHSGHAPMMTIGFMHSCTTSWT